MNIQHDCTHIYKLWDKEEIFTIVSRGLQPFGYIFLIFFIYDASFLRVFFCNKLAQFISSYLAYIIYIIQKREKGETDDDTMFIYILLHGNSILYFSNLPLL